MLKKPSLLAHLEDPDLLPFRHDNERKYITGFDPATGFHLVTAIADSEGEIREKISKAAKAQKKWKKTSFRQRRRVVRSLKKWLVDNQKECAQVACRDTGKTCASRSSLYFNTEPPPSGRRIPWGNSHNLLQDGVVDEPWRARPPA